MKNNNPLVAAWLACVLSTGVCSLHAEEYASDVVVESEALADYYLGEGDGFSEHGVVVLGVLKTADSVSGPVVSGNGSQDDTDLPFQQSLITLGRYVDVKKWAAEIGDDLNVEAWSDRLSDLIPHPKTTVVVYGGGVTPTAARAWWILKRLGLQDVRVFSGDAKAWGTVEAAWREKQQRDRLRCMLLPVPPRVAIQVQPTAKRLVEGEALRSDLAAKKDLTLIDARSEREYAAGCVPGAKRLEWSELVDAESGKLLPADRLREKFANVGVDPKEPTISYCRSGGRASVVVLALTALGSDDAANYYGSWNEWSQLPDAPVAYPSGTARP